MRYRVALSDDARAQLRSLQPSRKRRVRARIRELADDPWGGDVRELEGAANRYRAKAGRDRIIFEAGPGPHAVTVLRIGGRRTVCRGYERPAR